MNMKKILTAMVAGLAVLLWTAPGARAESLLEMQIKEANKVRAAARFAHNTSQCADLDYVGTSTESLVTISATSATFYAPFGTADTGVGSSGVVNLDLTTYDTMGEFCDYINGLTNYNCALLGCKRDDNPNRLRDQTEVSGTNDLKAAGGFSVLLDTGSTIEALTDVYDIRVGITPGSDKRVILKTCTGNANVAGTIRVYGKLRKYEGVSDGVTRNDTTEVWRAVTADDTDLQIPVDITENGWLEFAKDAHVVISAGNGTGTQAAANFMECQHDER